MPQTTATDVNRESLMPSAGIAVLRSIRWEEDRGAALPESHSSVLPMVASLANHEAAVTVRELTRADGAAVDAVLAGLSPESRHLRFHAGVGRVSAWMRRALADVDGHDRVGVVAEIATAGGSAAIGMAHLCRVDEFRAEVAVAVVDACHRRGVGRRLLEALRERAVELGYREVLAHVLPENVDVLRLAHRAFPGLLSQRRGDVMELRYPLGAVEEWEHEFLSSLKCR
jgi:GNAT superfamily N-acetyltransferase